MGTWQTHYIVLRVQGVAVQWHWQCESTSALSESWDRHRCTPVSALALPRTCSGLYSSTVVSYHTFDFIYRTLVQYTYWKSCTYIPPNMICVGCSPYNALSATLIVRLPTIQVHVPNFRDNGTVMWKKSNLPKSRITENKLT